MFFKISFHTTACQIIPLPINGGDILIPVAGVKVVSKGIKGAKELIVMTKSFEKVEKAIVMEAFAGTGGRTGEFAEVVYKAKTAEQFSSPSSGFLKNINKASSITNKSDFLNLIMQ